MQVGDGGLPGGPQHEFVADGPFRRAVGGLLGSRPVAIAAPTIWAQLLAASLRPVCHFVRH